MADEKTKGIEERRRKGMRMLKRGVPQAEVARALEVSRQTASRWAKMLADDPDAWRERKRGRPAGLTDRQMRRLDVLVRRSPKAQGFDSYDWSVALVAELIEREFGTLYKAANVRRILRKMGLYRHRRVRVEKAKRLGAWPRRPLSPHRRW